MTTRPGNIQAQGAGAGSKRTDLELLNRVAPLHDSSLQQGDIQLLESGPGIQPTASPQALQQATTPQAQATGAQAPPDPIELAAQRLGGKPFQSPQEGVGRLNVNKWLPLLRKLAMSPGASGALQAAYIRTLSQLQTGQVQGGRAVLVDRTALDAGVERLIDDGS